MALVNSLDTATNWLTTVLAKNRKEISFESEMLVHDTQQVLLKLLAALQNYQCNPTPTNRTKLLKILFSGKSKNHKPKILQKKIENLNKKTLRVPPLLHRDLTKYFGCDVATELCSLLGELEYIKSSTA